MLWFLGDKEPMTDTSLNGETNKRIGRLPVLLSNRKPLYFANRGQNLFSRKQAA